jgi:hypothetical protein
MGEIERDITVNRELGVFWPVLDADHAYGFCRKFCRPARVV